MRSFIRRSDLMALYKSLDHVHNPSIYDIKPGQSKFIEVNTFKMNFSDTLPIVSTTGEIGSDSSRKASNEQHWQAPIIQHDIRLQLRAKIRENQTLIRELSTEGNINISPRTQACNRKCTETTITEAKAVRADVLTKQLRAWRSILPGLIKRLSCIKDPRHPDKIKHKLTMLMLFGLFAFVFRLQSRREMNRELTSPVIQAHLRKLFPEIDSIPHADSLARILERINPLEMERVHIGLLCDLIRKKKFKKLLTHRCLPVSIDGTQKLYREGLLQDPRWCERTVGGEDNKRKQQYLYALEANITLKNGLSIPLMTEFLCRGNNKLNEPEGKQDSEITAFERLAKRLKQYFPKQKIIIFSDAMFATKPTMHCYTHTAGITSLTYPLES